MAVERTRRTLARLLLAGATIISCSRAVICGAETHVVSLDGTNKTRDARAGSLASGRPFDMLADSIDVGDLVVTNAVSNNYRYSVHNGATGGLEFQVGLDSAPGGLAFGPNGNLYVWIQNDGPAMEFDGTTGEYIDDFVEEGAGGSIQGRDIEFMPGGDLLVAGGMSDRVARFDGSSGEYLGAFISEGSGGVATCWGMVFGPNGNLFVASADTDEVMEYDGTTGQFITVFVQAGAGGLDMPYDLTFGPGGDLYVVARDDGKVFRYDGQTGAALGQFTDTDVPSARGINFGPNGNLLVCAWHGPQDGGVYEFDGTTGELLGQFAHSSAAMFLAFKRSECPADLDDDGKVNIDDVFHVLAAWGACNDCPEDLNDDGKVNIDDLFFILGEWGPCP